MARWRCAQVAAELIGRVLESAGIIGHARQARSLAAWRREPSPRIIPWPFVRGLIDRCVSFIPVTPPIIISSINVSATTRLRPRDYGDAISSATKHGGLGTLRWLGQFQPRFIFKSFAWLLDFWWMKNYIGRLVSRLQEILKILKIE